MNATDTKLAYYSTTTEVGRGESRNVCKYINGKVKCIHLSRRMQNAFRRDGAKKVKKL